ncbi:MULTISPECIES: hypothetical protein [unclassified Paenibacillus]|uniref:hypothetical protein n=1 Tax=unclassified Paenibacillus TaxID=185978 RepID=UPI002406008D|nr:MULTISPECIES: hypothetical protein [unclassified Paenibacillus]MDF9841274.1 hypothetical protein [Paenibacillus sp. PastF-2]MDF9847865.1 hypothetical protein [Paenibacillus sp. PastM-2]MDF9854433.1 hypothetical protein [Paenibacillus sp. PastF-1]MDH6479958.1 hypothetical protein [Paenibacillus sp. PastH-2]MDH6507140.1 hypothetical protein [Paenibacillus sp. PastM-3]
MERKIQLMETYVNIDLGNSPFLKLDNGLQIPYSSIKGITTGRPIPDAFKLYGALFRGMRNGLFRANGGYQLHFFENELETLHLDLNSFKVGKFKISKLIIGIKNPEEISKNISERIT